MSINIGVNIQRSPNRINQALRAAGVNGQYPKLLFDFDDEYYLTNGSSKTFANAMTFARAGLATMVDSDGLIKWAPHNLVLYSEDLDNNYNNLDLTISQAASYESIKMWECLSYGGNGFLRPTTGSVVVAGAQYTFKFWSRNQSSTCQYRIYDVSNTVEIDSAGYTTGSGATLQEVSFTAPAGCSLVYVYPVWDLNTGDTVEVGGLHLYRSDLGGMVNNPDRGDSYVPTTSSAVYLPRRGHHKYNGDQWVNKGLLIESEARTNLIAYSNDFTQWTSSGTIETAGQAIGRDGNSSLSFIENNSGATTAQTVAIVSVSGSTTYTLSIDLKDAGDNSVQRVGLYDTTSSWHGYIEISWSSGIPSTITNSGASNVNYENCGNGIYRISFTVTTSATISSTSFHIHPDRNGVVGAGIYAGFVSLESASTPSSYIPTNGATVTRSAETVTVPYANLPWPTPTYIGDELVTNGTFDTDTSGWSATNATFTASGGIATFTATANEGAATQTISTVAGRLYQISFDAKYLSGDQTNVEIVGLLEYPYAPAITSSVTSLTNIIGTFVATSSSHVLSVRERGGANNATSQIDNISVREINPLSVSIAMMGELTYSDNDETQAHFFFLWESDSNNRIRTWLDTSSTSTGHLDFNQTSSGVVDIVSSSNSIYSPDLNVPFNIASRHGSTFINGAVDGTALTANTTPVALPDLSTTDLNLAYDFNGTISEFRIWDKDIGDTGIAEATKPSLEPSLSLTFDGQPSSFTNTGLTS